ncbi:MAG: hypothetical protein QMC85_07685 [Methanocellales archaeon]|nr:hypothetical protein [Methanocellales archaeon]
MSGHNRTCIDGNVYPAGQIPPNTIAFLPSMAVRRKELRGGQRPRLLCELAISLLIALAVGFWLRFG